MVYQAVTTATVHHLLSFMVMVERISTAGRDLTLKLILLVNSPEVGTVSIRTFNSFITFTSALFSPHP